MVDQPHVRIVLGQPKDGKREVIQVDAASGREMRTGLKVADNRQAIDRAIKPIAETYKRSGSRVSYREE